MENHLILKTIGLIFDGLTIPFAEHRANGTGVAEWACPFDPIFLHSTLNKFKIFLPDIISNLGALRPVCHENPRDIRCEYHHLLILFSFSEC